MYESELAALQRQHALSEAARSDIETLLRRALSEHPAAPTLADPLATVFPEVAEGSGPASRGGGGRYEDLGQLGRGGMGEVRRVRDRELGRAVAMKILHPELCRRPDVLARFVEEAQATAQLQHSSVVPVHELGRLQDGRAFFTMREVRGRTLAEVIDEVHAARAFGGRAAPSGWTFRRLVAAFLRVCEAVAYAHDRGVVHRDLKPSNVMIGDHGEVLVVDWGLTKVVGAVEQAPAEVEPVITDRSQDASQATRAGMVAGTPTYMPRSRSGWSRPAARLSASAPPATSTPWVLSSTRS